MDRPRIEVSKFLHYRLVSQDESEQTKCDYCPRIGEEGTEIKVNDKVVFSGCNHCLRERLLLGACCGRVRTQGCQCGD